MKTDILFKENQKFTQWWVWLILLFINGIFIWGIKVQIIDGQPFGNNPMSDTGLLIGTCLCILFTLMFALFRLETRIREDGIYVRFFPLHLSYKYFPWNNLQRTYIRKYSPITEYGGWGLRLALFGHGKAYNVSGNMGLQLILHNGKKILIGTQKPGYLKKVLKKAHKLK